MSLEDYLSTSYGIQENYRNVQNRNNSIFLEGGAWKKKVLHATQLEKCELERKIKYFESSIQSLISHIMNE
jgi:hypothetical protein